MPETANSLHLEYRIATYEPMAQVARHKQVVRSNSITSSKGEGLVKIADRYHVVPKHDFIFLPPPGHNTCPVDRDHVAGER
jgi:hypothetical protein